MDRKIGAVWHKQKGDREYFTGEIYVDGQKYPIVLFQRDKRNENEPDWDILLSQSAGQKTEGIITQ